MYRLIFFFFLFPICLKAQETVKKEKVKLVHADKIESFPELFNGNVFYSGKVIFQHQNGKLSADTIVVYQKDKSLKAFSNVFFTMDNNELTTEELTYNDSTEIATATGDVVLRNPEQTLYTNQLTYERKSNKAFYNTGGTIISADNTISSEIGIYDLTTKTNTFDGDVRMTNDDYFIEGSNVVHYSEGDYMEFKEETYITDRKNPRQYIVIQKGKYYLGKKEAFLENRSTVFSDGTRLTADQLYYNQATGYGRGEGDVVIDHAEDNQFIKGGFGEFFKAQDSAFVTQEAYAVKVFEKDSFYLHADTLLSTKRLGKGLIRAYHGAKYFKSNLQGKADSISFSEATGEMQFFRDPIVWSGFRQISGDTIFVYSNLAAEVLDSVIVQSNAFAVSKTDSITNNQFHQLKSRKMLGLFVDETLDWVQAEGNAQSLVYIEDEEKNKNSPKVPKKLIGINRSDCGIIEADFENRDIHVISCRIKAKSKLYPPSQIPQEQRQLPGFNWRMEERMVVWQDIFK